MTHLTLERSFIFETRLEDVSSLTKYDYNATPEKIAQYQVGGTLIANMAVNWYGDLQKPRAHRQWGRAVDQIEERRDALLDMGVAKHHATIACLSGAVYNYYQPETFLIDENEDPEP